MSIVWPLCKIPQCAQCLAERKMRDYGVTEVAWPRPTGGHEWLRDETVLHPEGFISLPGIHGSWNTQLLVGP